MKKKLKKSFWKCQKVKIIFYYFSIKDLDSITFSQWQCFDDNSIDNDDGGLDAKSDASTHSGNAKVIVQCLIYILWYEVHVTRRSSLTKGDARGGGGEGGRHFLKFTSLVLN